MVNKRLIIAVACILGGGLGVITGLLDVPKIAVIKVLVGSAVGFVGYYMYERRRSGKPKDMKYGRR